MEQTMLESSSPAVQAQLHENQARQRAEMAQQQQPSLAHVNGFNADARPVVLCLDANRAAVATGKLVTLLALEDGGSQQFVLNHTDTVTCIAHSPEQNLGASGQVKKAGASYAEVVLWCATTCRRLTTLSYHQSDIAAVGFAQGGEVLITIGADREHTLAVWPSARDGFFNFRRNERGPVGGTPLAVCSAYKGGLVHGVLTAPHRPDSPAYFATFGAAHIKFWHSNRFWHSNKAKAKTVYIPPSSTVSRPPSVVPSPTKMSGDSLEGRRGSFGSEGPPRVVVAATWVSRERLVVGGSDGEVYFFERQEEVSPVGGPATADHRSSGEAKRVQREATAFRAVQKFTPHKSSVAMLLPLTEAVLCAYAEGVCTLLHGDRTTDIDLSNLANAPDTQIVGGAAWRQSFLLLATRTCLLRLDLSSGREQLRSCEIIMSQAGKALTAVCAHPVKPLVYTSSLDGRVRCYRTDKHCSMPDQSFKASSGVTCLAVSGCPPKASGWLAVGCDDGTLSVLGEQPQRYVFRRSIVSKKVRLTCARFSPFDASGVHPMWLAVGTDDGCIHTFCFKDPLCQNTAHSGAETVMKKSTLKGHSAPLYDIAFADTLPCERLVGVDGAGQAVAFDVPMGRRLPSVGHDAPFSPWTSPVGWAVNGCWSPGKQLIGTNKPLPPRQFHEVRGRGQIAVSNGQHDEKVDMGTLIQLFQFPCESEPGYPVPTLTGPSSRVVGLTYSDFSDCLLAASDTSVFIWDWGSPGSSEFKAVEDAEHSSPVRAGAQGVIVETPDGRKKKAILPERNAGYPLSPQLQTPAKEANKENRTLKDRFDAPEYWGPKARVRALSAPGRKASNEEMTPSRRTQGLRSRGLAPERPKLRLGDRGYASLNHGEEVVHSPARSSPYAGWLHEAWPPEVAPLPYGAQSYGGGGDLPDGSNIELGHIDTTENNRSIPEYNRGLPEYNREAPGVGEDELVKARRNDMAIPLSSPNERQQNEMGALLSQLPQPRSRALLGPADGSQGPSKKDANAAGVNRNQKDTVGNLINGFTNPPEDRARQEVANSGKAGPFTYRCDETEAGYRIEAQLLNGRLLRVSRNPLKRSFVFEGEVQPTGAPTPAQKKSTKAGEPTPPERRQEQLNLQIPRGFDIQSPPVHVEREFHKGRCVIVVARG